MDSVVFDIVARPCQLTLVKSVYNSGTIREAPQKKTGKCGNFSQVGDPPPSPLFGNDMFLREKKLWFILHFRTLGTFIVGGSPMLKTVKNGSGIRVDLDRVPA